MAEQNEFWQRIRAWFHMAPPAARGAFLTRAFLRGIEGLPLVELELDEGAALVHLRTTSVLWASVANRLTLQSAALFQSLDSCAANRQTQASHLVFEASFMAAQSYEEGFASVRALHALNSLNKAGLLEYPGEVLNDTFRLTAAVAPRDLLLQPLASRNNPRLLHILERMRSSDRDWDVWAAWIEDRWQGGIAYPALDAAYVGVPPSLWNDPFAVNVAIKKAVSSLMAQERFPDADIDPDPMAPLAPTPEQVEPQEATSIAFQINDVGRIEVDAAAFRERLQKGELQRELHEELRALAADLGQSCSSSNLLTPLKVALDKFYDAIGSSPDELSPGKAVLRGNALRTDLETDRRRREERDPERPPIPESIAGELQKLVHAWNVYVGTDQFLDDMDSSRLGPDASRRAREELADIGDVLSDAEREDLATADAIETLRALEVAARETSLAGERALRLQFIAFKNFARAIFKLALITYRAGKVVAGAGAAVGVGYKAIQFAHDHSEFLRKLAQDSPNMQWILEWLLKATVTLIF